ncbi:hypothetical protein ABPG73_008537 [Tetrahymena malaccensis]
MDQKAEFKNKVKSQKPSIFFKQASMEEESIQCEIDGTEDLRNDSKHLFEIKNCQPQRLHQGDSDISLSSFQEGMNNLLDQSQKDTINQSCFTNIQQEEVVQVTLQPNLSHYSANFKGQYVNNQVQGQEIKAAIQIDEGIQLGLQESQVVQESSAQSNARDSNNLNTQSQVQSNQRFSKNTIIKNETKNKASQNGSQSKIINDSRMKINSHILIQDDIFYERDNKKLGTKVNLALKSQYQQKQCFTRHSTYKQNLQKAANIIKVLFGSSISRVMRIRQYVTNFIHLLKLRHSNRRIEDLSEQELISVNDLSHFYFQKKYIYQSYKLFRVLLCFIKFVNMFPIFMPSNTIRVMWDVILVAFTYVFLYIYSLLIFFDQNYFDHEFIQKFNFIAFTLFLSDIIITFNTAFYDKDIIITKHKLIAKKYFFSSLASVVAVAHIAAIGWYFVGVQEANSNQTNWLEKIGIKSISIQDQYIYAIYWSITTMTTALEQKDRDKLQEDKILFQLSNKLRDEITLEINSKILNNYLLFSSNFSKSTLNKLIFIMKEILVNPNEIIINENQYDDSSIYFIQNGIIEIYQQQIQKQGQINVIQTLTDGQIFGDISFFTGMQRQASARSVNLSTLYKISREEFIQVLKENKEDFEHFKMMQDQIIFQKEKSVIHNACYYCKDNNHIANLCPRTHKIFDKQFIILKDNFSMFQERSKQKMINKKPKQNSRLELKRNIASLQRLKYNLQYTDGQNFFIYDENLLSSYESVSQSSNIDDEENTQSQIFEQQEKELYKKKSIKLKEKVNKSSKSIIFDKSNQSYYDETEQQINQDNQNQKCHQNFVYENQDTNKIESRSQSSQSRLRSFDATENLEINNEESQQNIFQRQKSQHESNKVFYRKDSDNFSSKNAELFYQQNNNQSDSRGTFQSNSNILDKQKIHLHNQLPNNLLQGDQTFNQIKKGNNNILNKQSAKQISNLSSEDNIYQDSNQIQQNFKLENNKKSSTNNLIASHSKLNTLQKNQKLQSQNYQERRISIDYAFQNIATFLYLQGKNISSQQLNSGNNIYQDNSVNNVGSTKKIQDQKGSRSSSASQKNNKLSNNSDLQEDNLQEQVKTNQSYEISKKQLSKQDLQVIDRLSKIIQQSQLPFLLQLTTAKSFQFLDAQNPMDYFDKLQCFKKYYPDYNINKIIHKIKILQQEQKRLKKIKLAQRERRQNIGVTKISLFQAHSNIIRFFPQQNYNINSYKPTYLSYGIQMQKRITYPLNNFFQQNN